LTDLLERAGSATVEIDGKRISGKRYLADMVWQVVMTGEAILPGGKKVSLSPQDWKDFVKWIYAHIDGPPTLSLDIHNDNPLDFDYAKFINTATRPIEDSNSPGQDEGSLHGETVGEDGDGGGISGGGV
jgi:hypothetical protein